MSATAQSFVLANDLGEISRLAAGVEAFCAPLDPAPKDLFALQLVLEEVVTNVINHGYTDGAAHLFSVELRALDRVVTAVVSDDAPAYDPLARPEVDTSLSLEARPVGGLGVHLVKRLVDTAHYERRDGRNVLTLTRVFGPSSGPL
jgi:anti-sigma regulatory factor (Ser/Thr protein kinase)